MVHLLFSVSKLSASKVAGSSNAPAVFVARRTALGALCVSFIKQAK